jgi:hypothetical protein
MLLLLNESIKKIKSIFPFGRFSMRRKEWFSDPSNSLRSSVEERHLPDGFDRSYSIFRPPSKFVPHSNRSERLDLYADTNRSSVLQACSTILRGDFHFSLSGAESEAISSFQSNHDVVIKDADKG